MPDNAGSYTRSDGTYSGATVFQQEAAAGIDIEAANLDAEAQDMADALNNRIFADGTKEPTANLPMDDFRHTDVAVASGSMSASEYASGRTAQAGVISDGGTTGGSDTAFTAALPFAPVAYVDKALYRAKFHAAFAATPTIDFNSLGQKKMYAVIGSTVTQLTTGQVPAGYIAELRYDASLDGGAGGFMMLNPPARIAVLAEIPIGSVMDFAGAVAPANWLLCGGQAVSRTTYAALFAAIGTTYGAGDGSTTFNVPDCRGRATFGRDNMVSDAGRLTNALSGGINGDVLGATGGEQGHILTTAELASHSHGVTDPGHAHNNLVDGSASGGGAAITVFGGTPGNATVASGTGISIQNAGSNASHNTVPPGIVFNKIIYAGA